MANPSITQQLYPTVEKYLALPENKTKYKSNLDKYMAANTEKYFGIGPNQRPIFSDVHMNDYMSLMGITSADIKKSIKESKHIGSNWTIMNNPFNVANVLALRYFTIKNDKEYIKFTQWYLIVSMYPSLHFKYFKYNTNEACMTYTINNISDKFKIRQFRNLWLTLCDTVYMAYDLHKDNIVKGDDTAYVKYIQDVHTRINSLLKNISRKYYENYELQNFVETEHESFDEDDYHEADSTTYDVSRLSGNVLNQLILHGIDMRLVEIAAKTAQVSVNETRTYLASIVNESHKDDMYSIIENILFLYLFNTDGEPHSSRSVGTSEFMIYTLQVYKRSNTTNKNIVEIKSILDKWINETDIPTKRTRTATILSFKKAFYTFFVLSIQKYSN